MVSATEKACNSEDLLNAFFLWTALLCREGFSPVILTLIHAADVNVTPPPYQRGHTGRE